MRVAVPLMFACYLHFRGLPSLRSFSCRYPVSDMDILWLYPGVQYKEVIIFDAYTITKGRYLLRATYQTFRPGCSTCDEYPSFYKELWYGELESKPFILHVGD